MNTKFKKKKKPTQQKNPTTKPGYLNITGITENSWQPPVSCIKTVSRTGCQNGPSALKIYECHRNGMMGETGKEQT